MIAIAPDAAGRLASPVILAEFARAGLREHLAAEITKLNAVMTKTPAQVADVIERFLAGTGLYPQEFNDFIDCSLSDPQLDAYRQRCEILHSEFETGFEARGGALILLSLEDRRRQPQRETAAIEELKQIVEELRLLERTYKPQERG